MNGDAINPGLQAALAVEFGHPAENLDKYFLGGVGGVGGIVQYPVDEVVNGLMVLRDKPGVGVLVPRF